MLSASTIAIIGRIAHEYNRRKYGLGKTRDDYENDRKANMRKRIEAHEKRKAEIDGGDK
jgi:hypothetical protein